jgi:GT2 family glycosyltransferase
MQQANMNIDLSIIIVTWNTQALTLACISSIYKHVDMRSTEIIVVDNNSQDQTLSEIRRQFAAVRLIENNQNLGFSKANNQGIRIAEGKYVLLLNSDTVIQDDSLLRMTEYLTKHSEVSAIGPILVQPDGLVQRDGFYRKFPSLLQVALFYTPAKRFSMKIPWLVKRLWEDFDESKIMEVDQIPGAALMASKEVFDIVGLLEEHYPIWFEDVDWCYRAKKAGCLLQFYPEAKIVHYGGQSFSQWQEKGRMLQLFSSMYIFFRIHRGRFQAELVRIIIMLASLLSIGFNFVRKVLRLPGFKQQDYEARVWFVRHYMSVGFDQELPV